jgi:hypothetical protein
VKTAWDTGLSLYHRDLAQLGLRKGKLSRQALITGLIPNQIFINKLYAMSMISLMTTRTPRLSMTKHAF